jgi:hypothetical protein
MWSDQCTMAWCCCGRWDNWTWKSIHEFHIRTFLKKNEDFRYRLPAFKLYYTASETMNSSIVDLSSLL